MSQNSTKQEKKSPKIELKNEVKSFEINTKIDVNCIEEKIEF